MYFNNNLQKFLDTVNQNFVSSARVYQVFFSAITALLFCQVIKFIVFSIKERRVAWNALATTGGMPSSHTACVVALTASIGFFQAHDNNGKFDYTFVIALIFSIIIIHDAMGIRYEAGKHAKILNNLVDEDIDKRVMFGFGKKGKLKEFLGHKWFEVIGGIVVGLLFAIIWYFGLR